MISWKEQEQETELSIKHLKLSIAHFKACCNLFRSCLYGGGLAWVPGLARFAEISPSQKFHSITYNVLSSVYMRAGPARLGEIPPLLTRDLG